MCFISSAGNMPARKGFWLLIGVFAVFVLSCKKNSAQSTVRVSIISGSDIQDNEGVRMKTIELTIDDSIFDRILNFLELLPKDKIKIRWSDSHIPLIDDAEQLEIEDILKNELCHQPARLKVFTL